MERGTEAMMKENRGFTLIELMIAIAVLSVMAAVLFQPFVVGGRIDLKASQEEQIQNAAKKTMEELKGYSLEELDAEAKTNSSGTVVIAGTEYHYDTLSTRQGYRLTREYGKDGKKADYLICAEVDAEKYSAEDSGKSDTSYSINRYQMPNIVDVSSFQNAVIDPAVLTKDDTIHMEELLLKVNPEETESTDAAAGTGEDASGESEPIYKETDIKKYLQVDLSETATSGDAGKQKLIVRPRTIYTVDSEKAPEKTLLSPLPPYKKQIVVNEKSGNPVNRIYLFLPPNGVVNFEKIYITVNTEKTYEVYVVAASPEGRSRSEYILVSCDGTGAVELYTNLAEDKPVSLSEAKKRLYHLTVTVYEADYGNDGGGGSVPKQGNEVLKLESTKSE
ncbi:MAG: type II secretion system protein [Clostridium sp.]